VRSSLSIARPRLARAPAVSLFCVTVLAASPVLADPVGQCQTATTSQVATNQCLQNTLAAAQHVLNLSLQRAQEKTDSLDEVTNRTEARPAQDQSQSDWMTLLQSNCALRGAFAAGASGSGQFIAACAIQMTRLHAEERNALFSGA